MQDYGADVEKSYSNDSENDPASEPINIDFYLSFLAPISPKPLVKPMSQRVLIVDSTPEDAGLIALMCALSDCKPIVTKSFEHALVLAQESKFDLVITEYHLPPNDNGIALIERLRSVGMEAPAIIMTGKSNLIEFFQPSFLNIIKVLVKPVTMVSFKAALDEALGR